MGNEITSKVDGNILTLTKTVNGKKYIATVKDTNGNGIFDEAATFGDGAASLFTVADMKKNTTGAKCEVTAKTTTPATPAASNFSEFNYSNPVMGANTFETQQTAAKFKDMFSNFSTFCLATGDDGLYQSSMPMFFNMIFNSLKQQATASLPSMETTDEDGIDPARAAIKSGLASAPTAPTASFGADSTDPAVKQAKAKPVVTTLEDGSTRTDYPNGKATIKHPDGSVNKLYNDKDGNRICAKYDKHGNLYEVNCFRKDGKGAKVKARQGASLEQLAAEAARTPEAKAAQSADKAKQTAANAKAKTAEVGKICQEMYNAMDGIGTKDAKLKVAISKINKGNVTEVLDRWSKSAYASEMGETSLIRLIGNETDGWSANVSNYFQDTTGRFLNPIKQALLQRSGSEETKELGTIIDSNYHSLRMDDSTPVENIQKLYEMVKEEKK